jgi:hypothetical protein
MGWFVGWRGFVLTFAGGLEGFFLLGGLEG